MTAGAGLRVEGLPPAARSAVLVHDAHRVFGEAVAVRLAAEPDLVVAATTSRPHQALAVAAAARPGLVLLTQDADSTELARQLSGLPRPPLLLAIGEVDEPLAVLAALRVGCRGWVSKSASIEVLVNAVRGVLRDETWLDPTTLTRVLDHLLAAPVPEPSGPIDLLTQRELDVLWCMVEGLDQAAIARRLYLSVNTVRTHRRRTLSKLAVHSSLEAVAVARRAGLIAGGRHAPVRGG